MTTLILEVDNKQKKVLKGILKYLKVRFYEQKKKKNDVRDFAVKIDYGIENAEITNISRPFSHIGDSGEYVREMRASEWN